MKARWMSVLAVVGVAAVVLVNSTNLLARPQAEKPQITDRMLLSYGVGYYLGEEIREGLDLDGVDANIHIVITGFSDGIRQRPPAMDPEEFEAVLAAVDAAMDKRMVKRLLQEDPEFKALYEANAKKSQAYLDAHKNDPGVITLPGGARYKVLKSGAGASPTSSDTVIVNYRITLIDGTVVGAEESAEVVVASTLAGSAALLKKMKVGDRWMVVLPPEAGFGGSGDPPRVGPNEVLVGEVELLGIK